MKTILIALLATITISCASNGHGKCDAYSKIDTAPKSFEQAELWLDSLHRENAVNKF
jgi:hypothetical protein